MFRDIATSVERGLVSTLGRTASCLQKRQPLAVDLLESEQAYLAVFDVPGASTNEIALQIADGTITVAVDRTPDRTDSVLYSGRATRRERTLTLPTSAVDGDTASAELTDSGTLRVKVPKTEPGFDEPIRIDPTDGTD